MNDVARKAQNTFLHMVATSSLRRAVALLALGCLAACAAEPEPADQEETQESGFSLCRSLPESWMKTRRLSGGLSALNVQLRVGEALPSNGAPVADILYMHGFSDRMDNHKPLFDEWTKRGARVVSFEYPSHGETCGPGLSLFTVQDLTALAVTVEKEMSEDPERPLYVAGWSTGGLIATRLTQGAASLSRPIAGAMLFAPGVDVQLVLGAVTLDSLTSDPSPPHTGPISPTRPVTYPNFSGSLLVQATYARWQSIPSTIPTLLFTGGDTEDTYANTPGLKKFVVDQRSGGANITGVGCPGGKHELDNEAEPIGSTVRTMAGEFLDAAIAGDAYIAAAHPGCEAF